MDALETSRPEHKQKQGRVVRTESLFPRFRTNGFNQNIAFQMCCSTLTPVRSRGVSLSTPKLRRQVLTVSNPVAQLTGPSLKWLRPETNQDQGKSSHPLATHPEKR